MESTVTWKEGMAFDGEANGHHFPLDAEEQFGGRDTGPRPKPLLLTALAGCTAMDVASILTKMRQPFTALSVKAEGELTDTHPKVFKDFTITYTVEGEVDPERLARAVALSRDRYCGVNAMLRKHAPIHTRILLNGEELPEPPPLD
ncbi:MAG: OsmC family peroxiredoxin [Deltaproteobacteria bacterium]|nr:MAG: OsmC family peroxiredoxin [Deltaproteobacteria bacterium]